MAHSGTGRRRIYLMRHGHVDYFSGVGLTSADEVPLTPLGQEEAIAAGRALAHVSFDRALCSGLPRTRATAEFVLAAQAGEAPELEVDGRLAEIKGGGQGKRFLGQQISIDTLAALVTFAFEQAGRPGARMGETGELFADAYDRITAAIEELLHATDWRTALVVAHEGVNRILLSWAAGHGLDAVAAFEQDTACINVLDIDMVPAESGGLMIERKIIKAVNLTPYNYVKHGMTRTSLEAIFARD
jgi:broad specificity phosphatase PhoE